MTASYLFRLLLLSSASFFLLRLVLEALTALAAPAAIRRAFRMRPAQGAQVLLTLRLLPSLLSLLLVGAICIPSYLRFEPRAAQEEIGLICLAAAALGLAWICGALWRSAYAWIQSARYSIPENGGIALAGIARPRVLVSARARRELSEAQLDAALRHEQAHRESRDNLKRLLMLLSPAFFPASRALQRSWDRCAEWAADDRAAGGDPHRALALAEALVRVARMQSNTPPLVTALIDSDQDLPKRVDRLLNAPSTSEKPLPRVALTVCATALALALATMNPTAMHAVHGLLERLLD